MRCAKPSGATEADVFRLMDVFNIREMVRRCQCEPSQPLDGGKPCAPRSFHLNEGPGCPLQSLWREDAMP